MPDVELDIESLAGALVTGRLSWEEEAVGGGSERRHVGRLTADTIRGAWLQVPSGRSGEFVAVRGAP